MLKFTVSFMFKGELRCFHVEAEDFDDVESVLECIKTAQVEGSLWAESEGVSRGRLN